MRIICLDIGSKRIGVAASDPMGWTAQGVEVIERRGSSREMDRIADHCRDLRADILVVGLPLNEEGGEGPGARRIRAFADKLIGHLKNAGIDIPMEFWDERYSTAIAEERLISADVTRAKRKKVIDKMAAVVILEDYLEAKGISSQGGENVEG